MKYARSRVRSSEEAEIRLDYEREKAKAQQADLERRLEFIAYDDDALARTREDALIAAEEFREGVEKHGQGSARGQRMQREYEASLLRTAEIQREINDRAGRATAARLQNQTRERAAHREAAAIWRRETQKRVEAAELEVARGGPEWKLHKAREEAKAPPSPGLIEAVRQRLLSEG